MKPNILTMIARLGGRLLVENGDMDQRRLGWFLLYFDAVPTASEAEKGGGDE